MHCLASFAHATAAAAADLGVVDPLQVSRARRAFRSPRRGCRRRAPADCCRARSTSPACPGARLPRNAARSAACSGREEQIGRAADVPRRMLRHRLVADARAWPAREAAASAIMNAALPVDDGRRLSVGQRRGNSAAGAPMLPAPMVTITSPSRAIWMSACGSSSIFSTNNGSTRPCERIARQIALPSAPAIGASPAAYTSVTISASTSPARARSRRADRACASNDAAGTPARCGAPASPDGSLPASRRARSGDGRSRRSA